MPRIVGAACMRPATFVSPYRFLVATAFGPCVGAAYMPPAKRRGFARYRFVWCLPYIVGRAIYLRPKSRRCAAVGHLRAKSRALRPGCAPKRRCGASPKRACGRSARRTDKFFDFYNVRRGQDPALQSDGNGRFSRNPRVARTPAGRHICLPYKHPVSRL